MAAASCPACGFSSADLEREREEALLLLCMRRQEAGPAFCTASLPASCCHTPCHQPAATMTKEEFFVDMTCEGCEKAVTRVLDRLGDVKYAIDLPNKTVVIQSDNHSVDQLLETLKKTGKEARHLSTK